MYGSAQGTTPKPLRNRWPADPIWDFQKELGKVVHPVVNKIAP